MTIRAIGGLPNPLAAILGGGDPGDESHPQAAAGSQFAQAVRLKELQAAYARHPGVSAFTVGDIIRLRKEFMDINPHRYPHKDYPAVVMSVDPNNDGYKVMGHKPDMIVHPNNMIIGILMAQGDGTQHFLFYTADAHFFEKVPDSEINIEVSTGGGE